MLLSKNLYKIGIDLGGTKIEVIILDLNNKEIFRKRIPTNQEKGYDEILNRIDFLYKEALLFINNKSHSFGIGIPGSISKKTNLVKNSNTLCLNNKMLKKDIIKKLKCNVEIQNDANCFTLAESFLGAGINKNIVFGVIIGTGCGGGISIKGEIHSGIQGIAGEWGHMQIDPAGPNCYCGKRGCVETYISGSGLERIYENNYNEKKSVQDIIEYYRKGDQKSKKLFLKFLENFGIALSNVIDILDPDIIILGGGLSNIDELYTLGKDQVEKNIFSDSFETPIVKNKLGDSAGVLGAAIIGVNQ
ncbi:MAG: ROK family protein [Clostridiales bacterium]